MNLEEAEAMRSRWGARTLADLRRAAERNPRGGAIASWRDKAGRRSILILCSTKKAKISSLVKVLGIPIEEMNATFDWTDCSFLNLLMSTPKNSSHTCCVARAADGDLEALVVLALEPDLIAMLEQALGLPP